MAPNSPRDSGVGVVMPRAMKPDWVSKSKVRQTIWRGTGMTCVARGCEIASYYDGQERPWRSRTIGIILNGATGRIGSTQHVANALAPIRAEGGLPAGRRPHRAAPDAGRAQRASARRLAQQLRHRRLDHRSRRGAGRSGLHRVLRCRGDQPARGGAGARRSPPASTSTREKPVALSVAEGLRAACAPRRRAGSSTARSRTSSTCPACRSCAARAIRISSAASPASASSSAGGCSTAPSVPCQRPSWNYRKSDGGGLILDMYPHWRYVIENTLGPIRRVIAATVDRDAGARRRARRALRRRRRRHRRRRWSSWRAARSARSSVSWATRVRRDDLLTFQIDGTGGSALAGLHRCWSTSATRRRRAPRTSIHRHRHRRRLSRRLARGRRRGAVQESLSHRLGEFPAPCRRRRTDAARFRRRHPRRAVRRSVLSQRERTWMTLDDTPANAPPS